MSAIPQYCYLTDYEYQFDYFPSQNEVRGNTIFGRRIEETTGEVPGTYDSTVLPEEFENTVQTVAGHNNVWLVFAHSPNEETNNAQWQFLVALEGYGHVTLMNEYAGTLLYKFQKTGT
jgi:hypothetical protein